MKIQKLTLEGFRGFREKTEFELHPNVNVFVGVNGSGKTSVLDAVGMLLNQFTFGIILEKPNNDASLYLSDDDINIESSFSNIQVLIKDLYNDSFGNHIGLSLYGQIDIKPLSLSWKTFYERLKMNKELSIPVIRYFKINQVMGYLKEDADTTYLYWRGFNDDRTEIYKTAFNLNTDFDTFANWYINEENDENRVKVETKNLEYNNPKLMRVRDAIENFFNKMDASSLSNLIGDVRGTNGKLSPLAIKKNGKKLNINQLSNGEKQAILYVADIASRLSIANPKLENTNEGEGVVLIDEIDAHLHPAWQRDIIPALTHVFPNVQFLVTTHSPQVLSNVKKESVHIIEDFKRVPFTPSIYGADSNYILNKIFGIGKQPKHSEAKFSEFYHALKDEKREKALILLKELEEFYGNRLDVQKARTSFEFEFDEYVPET